GGGRRGGRGRHGRLPPAVLSPGGVGPRGDSRLGRTGRRPLDRALAERAARPSGLCPLPPARREAPPAGDGRGERPARFGAGGGAPGRARGRGAPRPRRVAGGAGSPVPAELDRVL